VLTRDPGLVQHQSPAEFMPSALRQNSSPFTAETISMFVMKVHCASPFFGRGPDTIGIPL
jgi:hypothetical protein